MKKKLKSAEKAKILVVEEGYLMGLRICQCLEYYGYEIAGIISSAEEVVATYKKLNADLIIMGDELEGEMTGFDAVDLIRKQDDIPIIYMIDASHEAFVKSKIDHPFAYFVKPFQKRDLYSCVEMTLYRNDVKKKMRELKNGKDDQFHKMVENRESERELLAYTVQTRVENLKNKIQEHNQNHKDFAHLISEVEEIVKGLTKPTQVSNSLPQLCDQLSIETVQLECKLKEQGITMPEHFMLNIYRIVQAIINTIDHKTNPLIINVDYINDAVKVMVSLQSREGDNLVIDEKTQKYIKERVVVMNGRFTLNTRNKSSHVIAEVVIPFELNNAKETSFYQVAPS